jgi:hypothetical protein
MQQPRALYYSSPNEVPTGYWVQRISRERSDKEQFAQTETFNQEIEVLMHEFGETSRAPSLENLTDVTPQNNKENSANSFYQDQAKGAFAMLESARQKQGHLPEVAQAEKNQALTKLETLKELDKLFGSGKNSKENSKQRSFSSRVKRDHSKSSCR